MPSDEAQSPGEYRNTADAPEWKPEEAISHICRIQSELNAAKDAYQKLVLRYESLQKEYAAIQQQVHTDPCQSDVAYELFRSFVDSDYHKIILIDTAYAICYMNQSAVAHLHLPQAGILTGRRLFDFFPQKDVLKIKKKIDKAFFSGEKEKVKEVTFHCPPNDAVRIDLKLMRVKYRDRPSIRITIK